MPESTHIISSTIFPAFVLVDVRVKLDHFHPFISRSSSAGPRVTKTNERMEELRERLGRVISSPIILCLSIYCWLFFTALWRIFSERRTVGRKQRRKFRPRQLLAPLPPFKDDDGGYWRAYVWPSTTINFVSWVLAFRRTNAKTCISQKRGKSTESRWFQPNLELWNRFSATSPLSFKVRQGGSRRTIGQELMLGLLSEVRWHIKSGWLLSAIRNLQLSMGNCFGSRIGRLKRILLD